MAIRNLRRTNANQEYADIFLNGNKLKLDVDDDTYIVSDTNDEIQFFAGGVEIAEFDATAITLANGADLVISAADKLYFDNAGDTYIWEESGDDLHLVVGGAIMLQLDQEAGISTFNPSSANYDFRVLTDGGTSAINVDAAANAGKGEVSLGYTANPDGNNRAWLKIYPPAISTASGKATSWMSIQPDYAMTMAGTVPFVATLQLEEPNITEPDGSNVVSVAATLYIKDAPTEAPAGKNSGIHMEAGAFYVSDGHGTDGEQLTSGGDDAVLDWAAASCVRSSKTAIVERDNNDEVLATLVNTPVHDFKYKNDRSLSSTGDYDTDYVGVMADEAPWAMHHSGRILNPINTFGYTIQAFKALEKRIQELESK